jgi:hypothetical protein
MKTNNKQSKQSHSNIDNMNTQQDNKIKPATFIDESENSDAEWLPQDNELLNPDEDDSND